MKRLILTADDFGKDHSVNQAVWNTHHLGRLTAASLMVNGTAFEEAVKMARAMPSLGVGLHLALACGCSTLSNRQIPGLVDSEQRFSDRPVRAGVRYFFEKELKGQLESEIAAQFEKFHSTGLVLDHVDGHLNLHLHPVVFEILIRHAREWGIRSMRLTRDDFSLSARAASGRWGYRLSHALIFHSLSRWARPYLQQCRIACADRVYGLLQSGCVSESYAVELLRSLPEGVSELYLHPSTRDGNVDFSTLMSPAFRDAVAGTGVQLIRYQDLHKKEAA